MLNIIKKNKLSILILLIFYIILVYCHMQTFIMNDDLPYSLYFREGNRITNLGQVITNQIFDYSHISPRVLIHCIVQTLLIFDKDLWSFINPLIIISIVCLMVYLIKYITKTKINNVFLILGSILAFLLLYDYKYLVYWVAGSVNYVWVFLLMILFMIYYLKITLYKRPVITALLCLFLCTICEAMAVFVITLITADFIVKKIQKEEKINIKFIIFLLCSLLGFAIILFAPSTLGRLEGTGEFSNLTLLEKILTSTPVISMKIFKISIYNIFPILLFISIIYYAFYNKNKKLLYLVLPIAILYVLGIIFGSGWIYFIIGIYFLIIEIYIIYLNKDLKLLPILIGAYAVSYFLVVTDEYSAGRTNFHLFLILSMFILYNILINENKFTFIKMFLIIGSIMTVLIEIIIYYHIGIVKEEREKAIEKVQSGETNVLEYKIIDDPYSKFHIDSNGITSKDYWTYASFEKYYNLPEDIEIKVVED